MRFVTFGRAVVVLFLACCAICECKKKASKPRRFDVLTGPTDEEAWDAGLLESASSFATLLEKSRQYHHDVTRKNFPGGVLGYVTPWNRAGYDLAVQFRSKLTHVSPVWYQLKEVSGAITLEGRHEVNQTWITALREPANEDASIPLVVPRIIIELGGQALVEMLSDQTSSVNIIVKEVEKQGFDGVVLETWIQWQYFNGLENDQFRSAAFAFIRNLASRLHMSSKELIMAVPPFIPATHQGPYTKKEHWLALRDDVDGWSIMVYDYSSAAGTAGPNSPLSWLESNIKKSVLEDDTKRRLEPDPGPNNFMGINFYGFDYPEQLSRNHPPKAILGSDFLALLKTHNPDLDWHEDYGEHYFKYKGSDSTHTVWYPTPASMQRRLKMCSDYDTGISIWELGQGLERFFELL